MRFVECYRGCWKWKIRYLSLRTNRCVLRGRLTVIVEFFIKPKDCSGLRIIWICYWRLDSLMILMIAIGILQNRRFIRSLFPIFFIIILIFMVLFLFFVVFIVTSCLVLISLFLLSFSRWLPPFFFLIFLFHSLVFEV